MTFQRLRLANQMMNGLAKRGRKGFTLIELLVVVVIIGILASVALPSFVGAQDKARNASVQSNGRTVQMALEEFGTEHNGAYPSGVNWSAAANAFTGAGTTYMPGGFCPKSPWAPSTIANGQADAVAVALASANATNSVAAGTPANMLDANCDITTGLPALSTVGVIPNGTWALAQYGAVSYDYHAATQYYVLYTTGKKGKNAICVSAISNAGN